ncbi:MAG: alanine racemase [Candidatus Thorarchaeota archaeon]|jgi:D-serine deaminase-like pyridoxal phosphate-dependent protein
MHVDDLITPATLVDYDRLVQNVKNMANKAREYRLALRPHVKTHKCVEIAEIQRNYGASGITVSTMGEALFFAENGFHDITLATPIAPDKMNAAAKLAIKIKFRVIIDHPAALKELRQRFKKVKEELDVLLKVDCNYHRSGVDPSKKGSLALAEKINKARGLNFAGILTHGGHSYYAKTPEEIKAVADEEQRVMLKFAKDLKKRKKALAPKIISIGSTPTMMLAESIQEGITEIRPGSYVFYDYTQVALGVCKPYHCALSVLSSVISAYPKRLILDAGATALSLDLGPRDLLPDCGFGQIISDYDEGEFAQNTDINSLSQEHGKVILTKGSPLKGLVPGSRVRILPNHSCLAANLSSRFYVTSGDEILDIWETYSDR